jgi:FkbM family methyltransferase
MLKRLAVALCPSLPYYRAAIETGRWREIGPLARAVGWPAALKLWRGQWAKGAGVAGRLSRVRLPGYRYPLYFRLGGSDPLVVRHVFANREYAPIAGLSDVRFIIDCGANIGCATFYLLHRYPEARAVVVEPDAGNMIVCRRNLAPFRERVTFVEAGVWSAPGPLVVERGTFGDGAEWSYQVRPSRADEKPDVNAVTVSDLLAAGGFPRVDVLKVDIEGAESEVFGPTAAGWLRLVRNLAIEIHGPECARIVAGAFDGFQFEPGCSGELTLFRNIRPNEPASGAPPRCS